MANKQGSLKGAYQFKGNQLNVDLSLIEFEEDGSHILYCPALDLAGYGVNEEEAMSSFTICLSEFFHYTQNKGTFFEELRRLGWKIKKTKFSKMTPPPMSKLLDHNENFSRIFNEHSFRKFDKKIEMPVAC